MIPIGSCSLCVVSTANGQKDSSPVADLPAT
ncbi:hypothetical protein TNIN_210431, partial [Trichonephila inaurata madagascariensis]